MRSSSFFLLALSAVQQTIAQENSTETWPTTQLGEFAVSNFTFDSGDVLDIDLHYQTLGELKVNPDGTNNAILLLHGSTGSSEQFMNDDFAGVLFNPTSSYPTTSAMATPASPATPVCMPSSPAINTLTWSAQTIFSSPSTLVSITLDWY
jgi:hypothetical protein